MNIINSIKSSTHWTNIRTINTKHSPPPPCAIPYDDIFLNNTHTQVFTELPVLCKMLFLCQRCRITNSLVACIIRFLYIFITTHVTYGETEKCNVLQFCCCSIYLCTSNKRSFTSYTDWETCEQSSRALITIWLYTVKIAHNSGDFQLIRVTRNIKLKMQYTL